MTAFAGHVCLTATLLCLATAPARADWVLPAGGAADLGGGTASMGCVSVQDSGTLTLGGGSLVAAQNVTVYAGAQLLIGSGQVALAQQWSNLGTTTATTGGITRVASPGCPVVGQPGPVPLRAGPDNPDTPTAAATPVPATGPAALALLAAAVALLGRRVLRRRAV